MSIFQDKKNVFSKILRAVEKKFGYRKASDWKNRDFENLSFEINRETKILISPATLKRLFGKVKTNENYSPQKITLNALKQYSGYTEPVKKKPAGIKNLLYFAAAVLVLAVLLVVFFFRKKQTAPIESCTLELVKVEGRGPATAFFNYTVPDNNENIFLDYGDNTEWTQIKGEGQTRTHFCGIPGYHNAQIRKGKQKLTPQVKVFVPTAGWKALAYYFDEKKVQRYFPVPLDGNVENGIFHASRDNLAEIGLDASKIITVQLDNYRRTQKPGDSFSLKSRFKNSSFWPGIRCYSVFFTVQGTQGKMMFKFVGEGCSSYGEYVLSEKKAWGAGADLSGFAGNLAEWTEIEIKNENKKVSILMDDTVVFSNSYEQSIGEILGTTILFHGSGSVDYILLSDQNEDLIFDEDF